MSELVFQAFVAQLKVMKDDESVAYLKRKFLLLLHYARYFKFPIYISEKEIKYIDPINIVWAEAKGNYTLIHYLSEGLPAIYLMEQNLGSLEFDLWLCGLIRVHRSHMFNPQYLDVFNIEGEFIRLKDGNKLEVPKDKIAFVKKLLKSNKGYPPTPRH